MNTNDPIEVIETPDSARIILPLQPPHFSFTKGWHLRATFAVIAAALAPFLLPALLLLKQSDHPLHITRLLHPRDAIDLTMSIIAISFSVAVESLFVWSGWQVLQRFKPQRGADIQINRRFLRQHAFGPMDFYRIPLTSIRALMVVPAETLRRSRVISPGTFLVHVVAGKHSRWIGGALSDECATHLATTLAHQLQRLTPASAPDAFPVWDASKTSAMDPLALLRQCGSFPEITPTSLQFALAGAYLQPMDLGGRSDYLMLETARPWLGASFILGMLAAVPFTALPGLAANFAVATMIAFLLAALLWCTFVIFGRAIYHITSTTITKTWQLHTLRFFRRRWPNTDPTTLVRRRPFSRHRLDQVFVTTSNSNHPIYIATATPAAANALATLLRTHLTPPNASP